MSKENLANVILQLTPNVAVQQRRKFEITFRLLFKIQGGPCFSRAHIHFWQIKILLS